MSKRTAKAQSKTKAKNGAATGNNGENQKLFDSNYVVDASRGSIEKDKGWSGDGKVYEEDGQIFSTYLMKTELIANNNKFYVIQIIEFCGNFYLHTRYGRVGDQGVSNHDCKDLDTCKKNYLKTFKQKTGKSKGYTPIRMKTVEEKKEAEGVMSQDTKVDVKYQESKLHPSIRKFIEFIFDKSLMEKNLTSAGMDLKKLSLNDLSE